MRTNSDSGASNVIEVSFNSDGSNISIEEYENHLGSLVESSSDDPLADLLQEFEYQNESEEEEDSFDEYRLSYKQDLITMSETLMSQIKSINEKTARLSYYLTEMNIES